MFAHESFMSFMSVRMVLSCARARESCPGKTTLGQSAVGIEGTKRFKIGFQANYPKNLQLWILRYETTEISRGNEHSP